MTAPPFKVVRPVTVSDPSVPTLVKEELITEAPKVVAVSTPTLLIKKLPPVARLRLPVRRVRPPPKEEVAEPET